MKKNIRFPLFFLLILGCSFMQDCIEGLNLLPMYGGVPKCKQQLESDSLFFLEMDAKFKDRKQASAYMTRFGWNYFYKKDLESSMKRFNQAWLLDSLNAEVYWGFGNIQGEKGNFESSIRLLERSIKIDSNNALVYQCIASSYGQLFLKSTDVDMLNKNIDNLKKVVKIDPDNAIAYGQLTSSYSYFYQKDSANKYLEITDKLDPKAINSKVRKLLRKK